MTTKYADRTFLSVNGVVLVDLQSASLKQNFNAKATNTMTPDGFNRGFVQGNRDIDITGQIAIQNTLSRPKMEGINYEQNDVQLTFVVGADQFVCTGLFLKDVNDGAGGVGEEAKTTFNWGAIKLSDGVGNSSLFDLSLPG